MAHAHIALRKRANAKALRRSMTRAELLLWRYLKAHHLGGMQFCRQTPIGPYIADFCCHRARLIVELDGETHDFEERLLNDAIRDRWLKTQGYRVLRFTNDDVLKNIEGVVTAIAGALPPSLSLPHKGGGDDSSETGARSCP